MTRTAPPRMKTMSPRRAYLLVVGGDCSPFVGSEMPSPPPNCIPPKAISSEVTVYIAFKLLGHQLANRMPHGRPVANNHMMNRFSRVRPMLWTIIYISYRGGLRGIQAHRLCRHRR